MHEFQPLAGDLHALGIGTSLIADLHVIHAADMVRTAEHLQAAVLFRRPVDGDHAAGQIRKQAAVVVPVSVVLVPGPGTADAAAL